jgi:hypothetical protein
MEWSMKSAGARFLAGAGLLAPLRSGKNEIQASLISSPPPARLRLPPPIFLLVFALAALASPPQSERSAAGVPLLEAAVQAGSAIRQVAPACAKPGDDPDDYAHHGHGHGRGHHHHGKPPKPPHHHK